tara:strand:+ start:2085 stop:2411 length:327 start_codon:yes stop_codon:yes gene_type:complete
MSDLLLNGEYIGDKLRVLATDGKTLKILDKGQYERVGLVPIVDGERGKLGRPKFVKRNEGAICKDAKDRGADVLVEFDGRGRQYTAGLARVIDEKLRKRLGLPLDPAF